MDSSPESSLGSLAQSARTKQLKSARGILFAVGILTLIVNAIFILAAKSLVDAEIEKQLSELRSKNMVANDTAVEDFRKRAIRSTWLVDGIGLLIGATFIAFGFMVNKYPVPITITGLVLYIGCWAVYAVIDPTTMLQGWIVKILIIVGLFKAVQAALAYEHERKQSEAVPAVGIV